MAYHEKSPIPIVEGGTNATSMATTDGTVYFDGTRLVTTATGTAGLALVSGGAGVAPTYTTVPVAGGGTGRNTLTAHGVLLGAGTTAITQLAAAATGSTLMGATGADPAFTGSPSFSGSVTAGTSITATSGAITATSGNVVITAGNLTLPAVSATVGQITQAGATLIHGFGNGSFNTFVGQGAGNLTNSGQYNTGIGNGAVKVLASLTSGGSNTAVGAQSLNAITTGSNNTAIGLNAGLALTVGDSNNILFGYNVQGTAGNNNVLRIATGTGTGAGQVNQAFIGGIQGITVTGTAVLVSAADQLGIAVSSRKYKDNIQDMAEDSSPVMKLRPVTFTLKEYQDKSKQFGLIAEEVHEIMPEIVVLDKEGQPQSVQYHNLPVLLLNEIQKLRKRIEILEGK